MGYFPFFVELSGKKGLIVGGGQVALRKAEKLLPYGPDLTLVAGEIREELRGLAGLHLLERPFLEADLEGVDFAVAATDDRVLNRRICALCKERRILINSIDGKEEGSFLFPALIYKEPLSVGISTGGASPASAAWLRETLEQALPEHVETLLTALEEQREGLRPIADGAKRQGLYRALCRATLQAGRLLTETEFTALEAAWEENNHG